MMPQILIANQRNGLVLGIVISTVLSSIMTFMFVKAMRRFKNQTVSHILLAHVPKWISIVLIIYLGYMWFIAGGIVLISFTNLIKRYILPDMPAQLLLTILLIAVFWCASQRTRTVMYLLEIILITNIPFILLILYKSVMTDYMNWLAVWNVVSDYFDRMPNHKVISAATYLFTGYINMAVFNKESEGKFRPRLVGLIPIVGLFALMTTAFVPVGFHGPDGALQYVNVWVSTADSVKIEFGIVERVIYVFLLLYLNLSLIFATVTWHVGSQIIGDVAKRNWKVHGFGLKIPAVLLTFALSTYFVALLADEKRLMAFATQWLQLRFWSEIFLVLLVFLLSRKAVAR
ncbi:GerAB/ArcD/ProY family transporter [Cohnella lubricantis]|uniref:GerAB/ArcD/ProY family transporter n=1 Tax=Cohnella lubricantis TaxID=2163172 RepID=A0A841TE56_9BACL|nr:GerAB/ArcD/ProY family transporter [Cohnella lubricantis]MBB6678526.1 GerAB/ArcD/ProY family transporter [Cohnella lubricantis]MBP2119165.1 hypothetical protein [Cohnella lubricantis]